MAATPFTATLFLRGEKSGNPFSKQFTFSDVAGERGVDADTALEGFFQDHQEIVRLVDIQLSAAGVDTSRLRIMKGSAETEVTFRDASLADTSIGPNQRLPTPIRFAPGRFIGFKQLA